MTDVSEQNTAENIPLSIFNMFGNDDKKTELPTLDKATKAAYLKRFAKVAIAEKEKYGIPASLILANALHQSFAGTRSAALQANNHFGLPCSENWAGTTATLDGACVRKYENAWSSFRDHSLLLSSGKFGQLKQFGNKDYKAWAKGLQKLGYPSVNSDYLAADLVAIIETWGLARLDDL
jgi:flagellum-specific peptidoglycan hydrolase FlgJ